MKFLTKNTDYAVRALIELAQEKERPLSARAIADRQDIPYQYLRRLLQALIKEGIVTSKEGVRGGMMLNRSAKSIGLADIIRLFQGDIKLSECMFRKRICCNRAKCVLRKRIAHIEELVKREMSGITIEDLLSDVKGVRK